MGRPPRLILERIAAEVIRQRAPGCQAEILEPQGFLQVQRLRVGGGGPGAEPQ